MFPGIGYDPIIDYYRLKQQYVWLTPEIYYPIYEEARKYENVTMDDLCAIIQYESGNYCHNKVECMKTVVSSAGATGVMQIMKIHHAGPRTDLNDPALNIKYGARFYSWCLKYTKGDKKEALRCYNAGPFSTASNYKGWIGYVTLFYGQAKRVKKYIMSIMR